MTQPDARSPARPFARWACVAGTVASLLLATGCATTQAPAPEAPAAEWLDAPGATDVGMAPAPPSPPPVIDTPAQAPRLAGEVAPVDPLRPDVAVNLDEAAEAVARLSLWDRVRSGFAMEDLDTDLVRNREQWYASRPDYVERMTTRGGRYLFHIVEEVERRGLPTELALLPFIESAFNPQALSSASASGIWQFMPATGRYFDLKQNLFRDDRRDVLASTRAALDYLQKLHQMFGDWHLALAAYNWGEGSVQRAIARNQRQGLPTDYLSLRMPSETRYYVPKLQAVKNIIADPAAFGLSLPSTENHPYFLAVPIDRDMDVEVAARFANLKVDEFRALNPQMNKPVILAAGTPQILMPYDNAGEFVRQLRAHEGPLASWTAWVATRTMRPADAAKELGMPEATLREVNRIPPRMLIRAGSTLLVPRTARHNDVSDHLANNATMAFAPDAPAQRRVTFKARPRESVSTVARRYGLRADRVAAWNKVSTSANFKAGQTVIVYLARTAAPTARKNAAAPRAQVRRNTAVKPTSTRPAAAASKAAPSARKAAPQSRRTPARPAAR